jgi:hypothetical protein
MPSCLVRDLGRGKRAANDQLSQRGRDPAVGRQVSLNVLLHGERHVRMSIRLLSGFKSIFASQLVMSIVPTLRIGRLVPGRARYWSWLVIRALAISAA